ncbi:TrbC/VirB2 family protein [Hafnia paralvei]|jgi:hypothetical protein|uniref:TrbC/VirB2 family protein n=1 Tax=Hafnia paralvei TaxID=546367 RepID=UPI002FDBCEDF
MKLKLFIAFLLFACVLSEPALAAGGLGNLDKATDALEEVKTWLFGFVGVASLVYITYLVGMALAEKKQWNEVMMGIGYCALAGGALGLGNWALTLWD